MFQNLIVEFCIFQCELHENADSNFEESVLLNYDNTEWKMLIQKIYESILDEINIYCNKIRYSK